MNDPENSAATNSAGRPKTQGTVKAYMVFCFLLLPCLEEIVGDIFSMFTTLSLKKGGRQGLFGSNGRGVLRVLRQMKSPVH